MTQSPHPSPRIAPRPPPHYHFYVVVFKSGPSSGKGERLFRSCPDPHHEIFSWATSVTWDDKSTAQSPWCCVCRRVMAVRQGQVFLFFPLGNKTKGHFAEDTRQFWWFPFKFLDSCRPPPSSSSSSSPHPSSASSSALLLPSQLQQGSDTPTFSASVDAKGSDAYQCCAPVSLCIFFLLLRKNQIKLRWWK